MTTPKSPEAFPHAREALERAVESERGIAITFPTHKAALHFRFSCYTARSRLQRQLQRILSPEDPSYHSSPYSKLSLEIEELSDGRARLKIYTPTLTSYHIEEL